MNFLRIALCVLLTLTCGLGVEAALDAKSSSKEYGSEVVPAGVVPVKIEYPHMISVEFYDDEDNHWWNPCVGALVAPNKVVTSASCYSNSNSQNMTWQMVAGRYTIHTPHVNEQIRGIESVHLHPLFQSPKPSLPENDYVVLIANVSFENTKWVRPIGMATPDLNISEREQVVAVGWYLSFDIPNPQDMQEVSQTVISGEYCQQAYDTIGHDVPANVLCAGTVGEIPPIDMRGNPLLYNKTLVGINTLPIVHGSEQYPSLFSKISAVVTWIEQVK